MTTIAFSGLGRMGEPMAARLVDAGHDVTVWNRTAERARSLVERGAKQAGSPAEAASGAEVAITMLTDAAALEAVLFSSQGLAGALAPGVTLIEMSTVGSDPVRSWPPDCPTASTCSTPPCWAASRRPPTARSGSSSAASPTTSGAAGRCSRPWARRGMSARSAQAQP